MRIDNIKMYSDGSGFKGMIEAAAIRPNTCDILQFQLGTERWHTVFEAELVGVLLALKILDKSCVGKTVLIALDNQAAILALANNCSQPGQHILNSILNAIKALQNKRRTLRIHLAWVPGHEGIEGNKLADKHAKEVAEGAQSNVLLLPPTL
jgi:ribonuclease HI